MKSQELEVQNSLSPRFNSYQQNLLRKNTLYLPPSYSSEPTSNRDYQRQYSAQQNPTPNTPNLLKCEYRKLLHSYKVSLQKLQTLKNENQRIQKEKNFQKNALQLKLKQYTQVSQSRYRKPSQTSTVGQDEQIICRIKPITNQNQKVKKQRSDLQKRLQNLKKQSMEQSLKQQQKIQFLKAELYSKETQLKKLNKNYSIQQLKLKIPGQKQLSEHSTLKTLTQKLKKLQQKKSILQNQKNQAYLKIQQTKKLYQEYNNKIQYFKETQHCCLQILNEQLCQLSYKIQGKRIQYNSNKKYLDRIIRSRKNEEQISFQDIEEEIADLNYECEEMMRKKRQYYGSQIKKYRQKRLAIMEGIENYKNKIKDLEEKKRFLQKKVNSQTIDHDQLQDEYFSKLQKMEEFTHGGFKRFSVQELQILKQKNNCLIEQISCLHDQYNTVKKQIQANKDIVPQNLVKQFSKKIKKIKKQVFQLEQLYKNNEILLQQNKQLNEKKQKQEWNTNPDIQKIKKEQKRIFDENKKLIEQNKELKSKNDKIQGKVALIKQQNNKKQRKQQPKKLYIQEGEKLQEQQIRLHRQHLMQKFRYNKVKQQKQEQKIVQKPKSSQKVKQNKDLNSKRGKGKTNKQLKKNEIQRVQKQLDGPKLKNFFGQRENPLEVLQMDFPLNKQQEICRNLSLIQSNPTLYMVIIFVLLVVPGMLLGFQYMQNRTG